MKIVDAFARHHPEWLAQGALKWALENVPNLRLQLFTHICGTPVVTEEVNVDIDDKIWRVDLQAVDSENKTNFELKIWAPLSESQKDAAKTGKMDYLVVPSSLNKPSSNNNDQKKPAIISWQEISEEMDRYLDEDEGKSEKNQGLAFLAKCIFSEVDNFGSWEGSITRDEAQREFKNFENGDGTWNELYSAVQVVVDGVSNNTKYNNPSDLDRIQTRSTWSYSRKSSMPYYGKYLRLKNKDWWIGWIMKNEKLYFAIQPESHWEEPNIDEDYCYVPPDNSEYRAKDMLERAFEIIDLHPEEG